MLVDGAAVRPDVFPQPTAGATVRLVCDFSSPLLGVGFTLGCVASLGYLHTARLVVLGSGVLAGVDRQGAQGREGQAQLAFPWEICFGRGPVAPGVRPAGGMDPQKRSFGCLCGACQFPGRNWFPLAGG